MRDLIVRLTHKTYPIQIGNGCFSDAATYIQGVFPGRKVFIVTDRNIASIYGEKLVNQLREKNVEAGIYVIPAGENSKSHHELMNLYNAFAASGITRKDAIVALGGGVTGDLTGYAASTWLRGTGFLQIPTSLLAMVDSSIGGKVAVNLPIGKNLVGSFYHPEAVLIDPYLLISLTDRHFADGMAEVIKYGCIWDEELFSLLENLRNREGMMSHIEEIIWRCCDIKRQVVERDEKENDLRMILNFGHTFGHAIERAFAYEKYTHGEAVSMGMVFIAELSTQLGFCSFEVPERIRNLLKQYDLPVDFPDMEPQKVLDAVLVDKKARTNDIHLVMIRKIGQTTIEKYPKSRMGEWIYEKLKH